MELRDLVKFFPDEKRYSAQHMASVTVAILGCTISLVGALAWGLDLWYVGPIKSQLAMRDTEVLDAQTRYKQAMADVTLNKGIVDELHDRLKPLEDLPDKYSQAMAELTLKKGIIEQQEKQIADLHKAVPNSIADLTGQCDRLKADNAKLQEQLRKQADDNQTAVDQLRSQLKAETAKVQDQLRKQTDDDQAAADQLRTQNKTVQSALDDANRQLAGVKHDLASAKFNRQRWERFCKFYKLAKRDQVELTTSDLIDIFGNAEEVKNDGGAVVWIYRDESQNEYKVNLVEGKDNRKAISALNPLP